MGQGQSDQNGQLDTRKFNFMSKNFGTVSAVLRGKRLGIKPLGCCPGHERISKFRHDHYNPNHPKMPAKDWHLHPNFNLFFEACGGPGQLPSYLIIKL